MSYCSIQYNIPGCLAVGTVSCPPEGAGFHPMLFGRRHPNENRLLQGVASDRVIFPTSFRTPSLKEVNCFWNCKPWPLPAPLVYSPHPGSPSCLSTFPYHQNFLKQFEGRRDQSTWVVSVFPSLVQKRISGPRLLLSLTPSSLSFPPIWLASEQKPGRKEE